MGKCEGATSGLGARPAGSEQGQCMQRLPYRVGRAGVGGVLQSHSPEEGPRTLEGISTVQKRVCFVSFTSSEPHSNWNLTSSP